MGLMDWFQNVEGKHMDKLYTKPWLLPLIAEVSDFLVSCSHHTILGSIGLRENVQQNHVLLQQTPFLSCRFSLQPILGTVDVFRLVVSITWTNPGL